MLNPEDEKWGSLAVVYACFKSTQEHKCVTFELMSQFFFEVCVSKYDILFPYLPETHLNGFEIYNLYLNWVN